MCKDRLWMVTEVFLHSPCSLFSVFVRLEMVSSRRVSMLRCLCVENITSCHPSLIWAEKSGILGWEEMLFAVAALCTLMRELCFVKKKLPVHILLLAAWSEQQPSVWAAWLFSEWGAEQCWHLISGASPVPAEGAQTAATTAHNVCSPC